MIDIVPYECMTKQMHGETYVNVREVYLKKLISSVLSIVEVNENWYRQKYPDVDAAIGTGEVKTAKAHYINAGYFEGRLPRKIFVDDAWYLKTYGDVADSIAKGQLQSAQEHFDTTGFMEGRLAAAGWHL